MKSKLPRASHVPFLSNYAHVKKNTSSVRKPVPFCSNLSFPGSVSFVPCCTIKSSKQRIYLAISVLQFLDSRFTQFRKFSTNLDLLFSTSLEHLIFFEEIAEFLIISLYRQCQQTEISWKTFSIWEICWWFETTRVKFVNNFNIVSALRSSCCNMKLNN